MRQIKHPELQQRVEARYQLLMDRRWQRGYTHYDGGIRSQIRDRAYQEAVAEYRAEIDKALKALTPSVEAGRGPALTEWIELVAKREDVIVVWRHAELMPDGALAFAKVREREAHAPILADGAIDGFGSALHEIGHVLAEPHQGVDHQQDENPKFLRCLACEAAAWEVALTLAPVKLLPQVHEHARRSLSIYTNSTPGTRAGFRRAEMVRSKLALMSEQTRRLRLEYPTTGPRR